jgi:hypothetical protein
MSNNTRYPDYDKLYKEEVQKNIVKLLNEEIDTEDFQKKLNNWSNKFEYAPQEVLQKIKEDKMFACNFIKDPSKQSFHQKIAANYIKSLEIVQDFKLLPAGGKNALYVIQGEVISRSTKPDKLKSIDFMWKAGKYTFYASHKYTKISGGSQDNQFHDILGFLKEARGSRLTNTIFIAICDGGYYTPAKFEIIKRECYANVSYAMKISELEGFLKTIKVEGEGV